MTHAPTMHRHRGAALLGLAVAACILAPTARATPASAQVTRPTDCSRLPATQASAVAPHFLDSLDDQQPSGASMYELDRAWVGTADEERFTVHVALGDLAGLPVGSSVMATIDGDEWVVAELLATGWRYRWATVVARTPLNTVWQEQGITTGRVHASDEVVSIDYPGGRLPQRPADGTELAVGGMQVRVGTLSNTVVGIPNTFTHATVDGQANASICEVVLFERVDHVA